MDLFYDNGKWWSRDTDGEIREATSHELIWEVGIYD